MNIKFVNAQRINENEVHVTYQLNKVEFTVEWNNVHPETGDIDAFDLQLTVASSDDDLAYRVHESIRVGETDSNPDLELYLFVRDKFDRLDCESIAKNSATVSTPEIERLTPLVKLTACDGDNYWFDVEGETFGIRQDATGIMDFEGRPATESFLNENWELVEVLKAATISEQNEV